MTAAPMDASMTPLILVPTDAPRFDGYVWHARVDTYLKAVAWIGAVPLLLPSLGDALDLDAALRARRRRAPDRLALQRASARYGDEPSERHEPYDLARDDDRRSA